MDRLVEHSFSSDGSSPADFWWASKPSLYGYTRVDSSPVTIWTKTQPYNCCANCSLSMYNTNISIKKRMIFFLGTNLLTHRRLVTPYCAMDLGHLLVHVMVWCLTTHSHYLTTSGLHPIRTGIFVQGSVAQSVWYMIAGRSESIYRMRANGIRTNQSIWARYIYHWN